VRVSDASRQRMKSWGKRAADRDAARRAAGHAAGPPPTARRRLLPPPLRLGAQPLRPSPRGRHRRRLPAGPARPRRAAHPGRPRRAHRTGPPPCDRFLHAAGVSRCARRRRHARLEEQRVFDRCERPHHAPRPRRAELFSNHPLRRAVTALAVGNVGKRRDAATGGHADGRHAAEGCCNTHEKPRSHDTSRIAWAKLMARVGEEFPLLCPACGGDIRLISFITEPGPIRKILTPVLPHTEWRTGRTAADLPCAWAARRRRS
jgi:hypothetical protein